MITQSVYVKRTIDNVLWNEILTGQALESICKLAVNMGTQFPKELFEREYYLLVTGLERRAYRTLGIDAVKYDALVYACWLELQGFILEMGYEAVYTMHIFDDTKRLVFVLSPIREAVAPIELIAEKITHKLQEYYEKRIPNRGLLKNFSVYSESLRGVQEIAPSFKKLCKLHGCAFFQREPYLLTERMLQQLQIRCEYRDLLQMSRELMSLIVDGDEEDVLALLEEMYCKKIKDSYDVELCYDTSNAVIARLLELDDAYELGLTAELDMFVPQKCATFCALYNRVVELVGWCMRGVRESKRRYCAITRAAVTYIHRNYAKAFTLAELSDSVNAAPSYVSRMFNRDVGESIPCYLTRIRIRNAARMLLETEKSVREIAQEVGFLGASYFGRIFKEEMGLTPKAYREQHMLTETKGE